MQGVFVRTCRRLISIARFLGSRTVGFFLFSPRRNITLALNRVGSSPLFPMLPPSSFIFSLFESVLARWENMEMSRDYSLKLCETRIRLQREPAFFLSRLFFIPPKEFVVKRRTTHFAAGREFNGAPHREKEKTLEE